MMMRKTIAMFGMALSLVSMGCELTYNNPLEIDSEHELETESESEHELETESESEHELETESESEHELETETESETELETDSESETELETETESETELETETESETELETDSESETGDCDEDWRSEHGICLYSFADGQRTPSSMTIDETHVYWTNRGSEDALNIYLEDGGVYRTSKSGGDVEVLAEGLFMPDDIVVDDQFVYWTTRDNEEVSQHNWIWRVAKNGESAPKMLSEQLNRVRGLVVDANYIYFMVDSDDRMKCFIMRQSKAGDEPATTLYDRSTAIYYETMSGELAFYIIQQTSIAISPDETTLFWVDADGLVMAPVDGQSEPFSIEMAWGTGKLTADETSIYAFFENEVGFGYLMRYEIPPNEGQGELAPSYDTSSNDFSDVAHHGDFVYWNTDDGKVARSEKSPGETVVLIDNQTVPGHINVDDENVYWINRGDWKASNGEVLKMRNDITREYPVMSGD